MLFVGTAGWAIPKELADRYASSESSLRRYAGLLDCSELNSTFYRRHRVSTFERWRDGVPASFRFSVRLPRAITHWAGLAPPRREVETFFDDAQRLGDKLGPVLVQLPASVHFEARRAAAFFRLLRQLHDGLVACEPRHASWYGPEASALFTEHDIARVVTDPPRPLAANEPIPGSSLLYVRWHASARAHLPAYSGAQLSTLAALVARQPARVSVWCIFDNTVAGAALYDALHFQELLSAFRPRVAV